MKKIIQFLIELWQLSVILALTVVAGGAYILLERGVMSVTTFCLVMVVYTILTTLLTGSISKQNKEENSDET